MIETLPLVKKPNAEPVPGYRLVQRLGAGGYGEVWKCEAPGGLFKAIKFVFGQLNALEAEGYCVERELKALQRVKAIRHPFLLSIERIELIADQLVIMMELADGSLLDRLLKCQEHGLQGIPRDELLSYLLDAAEGLDLMNLQHDLQHLDIKPSNLLLVGNRVKVADFGLAASLDRLAATSSNPRSGTLEGVTPLYASPETFSGQLSRTSDQYSLAVVYQEMLTSRRPFSGRNPRQLAVQHTREAPDLRCLSGQDQPIVAKALAKDPQERFPSCLAFVRALVSGQLPAVARSMLNWEAAEGLSSPSNQAVDMAKTVDELFLADIDPTFALRPECEPSSRSLPSKEGAANGIPPHPPRAGDGTPAAHASPVSETTTSDPTEQLLAAAAAEISRLRLELDTARCQAPAGPSRPLDVRQMAEVPAENAKLRQQLEQARERLRQSEKQEVQGRLREQEFDGLIEEKAEVIRQLHTQLQEAKMQSELAVGRHLPSHDELIDLQEELIRQREQLKMDEEELMQQMRAMEIQMSKERADLARQRNELQLLHRELQRELELASRDAALREKLGPLYRLQQEISNRRSGDAGMRPRPVIPPPVPSDPAAQTPVSDSGTRDTKIIRRSGFFRRMFQGEQQ